MIIILPIVVAVAAVLLGGLPGRVAQRRVPDIAVHECFASPRILMDKQKFRSATALNVGTQLHNSPTQ